MKPDLANAKIRHYYLQKSIDVLDKISFSH